MPTYHCPRCEVGRIFCGSLKRYESCQHCDYQWNDVGDAAIFFVMFFLSIVCTALAVVAVFVLGLGMVVGIALAMAVGVAMAPPLLRMVTFFFIRLNYKHNISSDNHPDFPLDS